MASAGQPTALMRGIRVEFSALRKGFARHLVAGMSFIAHVFGNRPESGLQNTINPSDQHQDERTTNMHTRTFAAIAGLATLCGVAGAGQQEFVFNANLSGDNEVPPADTPALGFFTGVFDADDQSFAFNWLISDNLVGDPSAPGAHIHMGPPDENGPIVFGFADDVWELSGSAVWEDMSDAMVDELFAGNLYANFHTTQFPGGEVRGQITLVPTPGTMMLAGAGLVFCGRRRRG